MPTEASRRLFDLVVELLAPDADADALLADLQSAHASKLE
jgi:hypothetical protein